MIIKIEPKEGEQCGERKRGEQAKLLVERKKNEFFSFFSFFKPIAREQWERESASSTPALPLVRNRSSRPLAEKQRPPSSLKRPESLIPFSCPLSFLPACYKYVSGLSLGHISQLTCCFLFLDKSGPSIFLKYIFFKIGKVFLLSPCERSE